MTPVDAVSLPAAPPQGGASTKKSSDDGAFAAVMAAASQSQTPQPAPAEAAKPAQPRTGGSAEKQGGEAEAEFEDSPAEVAEEGGEAAAKPAAEPPKQQTFWRLGERLPRFQPALEPAPPTADRASDGEPAQTEAPEVPAAAETPDPEVEAVQQELELNGEIIAKGLPQEAASPASEETAGRTAFLVEEHEAAGDRQLAAADAESPDQAPAEAADAKVSERKPAEPAKRDRAPLTHGNAGQAAADRAAREQAPPAVDVPAAEPRPEQPALTASAAPAATPERELTFDPGVEAKESQAAEARPAAGRDAGAGNPAKDSMPAAMIASRQAAKIEEGEHLAAEFRVERQAKAAAATPAQPPTAAAPQPKAPATLGGLAEAPQQAESGAAADEPAAESAGAGDVAPGGTESPSGDASPEQAEPLPASPKSASEGRETAASEESPAPAAPIEREQAEPAMPASSERSAAARPAQAPAPSPRPVAAPAPAAAATPTAFTQVPTSESGAPSEAAAETAEALPTERLRQAEIEAAVLEDKPRGSQLRVVLQDDRLGRLTLRVAERAGWIDAAIRTDSSRSARLIAEGLPALLESLQPERAAAQTEAGGRWAEDSHDRQRDQQRRSRQQQQRQQRRRGQGPNFQLSLD